MKNELENIIKKIIVRLESENKTISFAESCTAGKVVARFGEIAGVSSILNGSVVSYANGIKHRWLGVKKETLEKFGAVSSECVLEMLSGIKMMARCDYAIAVSGIAGPDGGTIIKPVGTVYIGILTPQTTKIYHCQFDGDRANIQEQAVVFSISRLAQLSLK